MANLVKARGGFNTGRLYTAKGQRIYFEQTDSGDINFADVDRMIHGTLIGDVEPNPRAIMAAYDAHAYHMGPILDVPVDFDFGEALRI